MNVTEKLFHDGRREPVEPSEKWTLAQAQEFVGGYIEFVPCTIRHRALVANEEGFCENLPPNPNATRIVRPGTLLPPGGLRGNALVVKD